jgi:hypothetical protein
LTGPKNDQIWPFFIGSKKCRFFDL